MAGLCFKLMKHLLISLNLIFFLVGLAAIGIGAFLMLDESYISGFLHKIPAPLTTNFDPTEIIDATAEAHGQISFLSNAAFLFIGVGGVIFVISFFGLCGGIKENGVLLNMYACCIGFFVIVEAGIVLCLFLFWDMIDMYIMGAMTAMVTSRYSGATLGDNNVALLSDDISGMSDAVDLLQVAFECCGVNNGSDYALATNWPAEYNVTSGGITTLVTGAVVPISCCKMANPGKWPLELNALGFVNVSDCLTTGDAASTNNASCIHSIHETFHHYAFFAYGAAASAFLGEFLVILAACVVACDKSKRNSIEQTRVRPVDA